MITLKTVLCDINGQPLTNNCILAASPLFKQPGTNPLRVVLRFWNGQFVVHFQMWTDHYTAPNGTLAPIIDKGGFTEGHYFQLHRFSEAMAKWCERVQRQVQYASSIYRDIHEGQHESQGVSS